MNRIARIGKRPVRPVHPGEILREDVLPALGISQADFARALRVSRRTINEVLNEKRAVSSDMAHRLGKALGNGPGLWLNLQISYDLWESLHADIAEYESIETLSVPNELASV